MKTKNNIFLTFLEKMQFSAIICLATYDWFCADGSHMLLVFYIFAELLLDFGIGESVGNWQCPFSI